MLELILNVGLVRTNTTYVLIRPAPNENKVFINKTQHSCGMSRLSHRATPGVYSA